MEYRQSTVGMISEPFGISTDIVNLILNDNQQLHKEEETGAAEQWPMVVPPGQCPMSQIHADDLLDDRQGNESGTTPTLQP